MKKPVYFIISVVLFISSILLLVSCRVEPDAPDQGAKSAPEFTPGSISESAPEPTAESVPEHTVEPTPEPTPRPEKTGLYYPGEYTAKAKGYGGYVVVMITVDDNAITDVRITGDQETSYIGGIAISEMPALILAAQSSEVDVTAGATFTSDAVIEAFDTALAEAKGE